MDELNIKKLEDTLWASADKLRGAVSVADYKFIVLGLIFLKYISDSFEERYKELVEEGLGLEEIKDSYVEKNIFYVPKQSRWGYLVEHSKDENIGEIIDDALTAIEKDNAMLKNVLPKNYNSPTMRTVNLGELIDLFTNIKVGTKDAIEKDILGRIYEYFLRKFCIKAKDEKGEFYTPGNIVDLMTQLIEPYNGSVYDPCCGSGGMFVQCSKFVKEHQGLVDDISIFGQESNPGTWKMAKMNLAIRGLEGNLGERNGDSFTDDLHKSLRADYIIANPPYNLKEYWKPSLEGDPRWVFGKPDEKNGNYAWLSLMYAKLAPKGKAAILMPNGATTSNTQDDYKIRKAMIESGKVEAILALPNKLFSNVSISVQCWILNKAKIDRNVLFINADEMGTLISRKIRVLEQADINKIVKTYKDFTSGNLEDIPGFCKGASYDEIKSKDYSLNPGRYVGADESNKMSQEEIQEELKKTTAELLELMKEGKELEDKVKEILEEELR